MIKFISFTDIAAGEQLFITDNGWLNANEFRDNEGVFTWTAPAGGISCGSIVTIDLSSVALSGDGDQLLIYQGTVAAPTFITALNSEGSGIWQAEAINPNTSALPLGLTNGINATALNEIDNAKYNGPIIGDTNTIRLAINDNTNWIGSNTVVQDYTDVITLTDCPSACTPPTDPNGTITGTTPACSTSTLTYNYAAGEPLAGLTYYWQTAAGSTATTNPVTAAFLANTSGDYFVKAFDGTCWSTGNVMASVTMVDAVNITMPPIDETATVGANTIFTVAADNTTLFQWQESTDAGATWTNVGGNTTSYTTPPVNSEMSGNLYRVLISGNSPCPNVISVEAELTVIVGACVDENFDAFNGNSFGAWTATGLGNYTSNFSSGISPNSVQFNSSGDTLESPTFTNAMSLSFWILGNGTNAASEFLIEGFNGSTWIEVDNISPIPTLETLITYDGSSIPSLPNNIQQFRFTSTNNVGNVAFDDVTVVCGTPVAGPEINISSNGIDVGNGSSPNFANNTNFGTTPINVPIVKTFTITNIGTAPLALTLPITLTDATAPQEFGMTQPSLSSLNPNETTTFTITFSSAVSGLFTNEINITNDDSDEGNYNFDIVANASDGTTPGTAFNSGDLIFVGYDGQINGSGSNDEYLIATMVDITTGTEFSIVNARYEAGAPANVRTEKWGGGGGDASERPFQARITYNGTPPIPAGSILRFESSTTNSWFVFVTVTEGVATTDRTADFTGNLLTPVRSPNISTSGADQMYLIQGDFASDGTIDANEANYFLNGRLLHGLTNRTPWVLLSQSCDGGGTRESRLPSLLNCFNVETASTNSVSSYYENDKEHGIASIREIINAVSDVTNNWTTGTGRYSFDPASNLASDAGRTFIIGPSNVAGQWIGDVDSNWFNCANWGDLSVPDATTDVIIDGLSVNDVVIDFNAAFSNDFSDLALSNDLRISNRLLRLEGSISNKIEVFGDVRLSASGILDMDDANTSTTDGELYLHGNWINQTNNAFEEGNSTVIFTGNAAQDIVYGTAPLPPINTEQFYNINLNNDFNTLESNDLYLNGSLIINTGSSLTITDSRYVHVDNLVTNNGAFDIENNGSLIQVQDVDNIGNLTVQRIAYIKQDDYVYWSSPVSGFNTNDLFASSSGYIFRWDTTMDNTPFGGSGEGYWVYATNATMLEGIGYIARTTTSSATAIPDITVFQDGVPNNGDVSLNLSRGSDQASENDDWNLIGNPYPSSISAEAFLTENTNLDGFINLWTHGAPPSNTLPEPFYENNSGSNYDSDDYITFNATGTTCSPNDASVCFDGFIGSGQSFMVNTINGSPSTALPISFTNTMRRRDYDNSNFFRSSNTNEKHRVWLDLAASDGAIANRIVFGYVTNATMQEDRLYDAAWTGDENQQRFFSIIDDKDFLIQGRALPFSQFDEIPLGFNILTEGNYTIAINAVDGLFVTENQSVFIKDNLLNITFNISEAPYTFNSAVGEFKDRFEIVFTADVLSIDDNQIDVNELTIIELVNGEVQFKIEGNLTIINVEILDVVGRQVYNLKGNNSTERYNLSRLSKAAYIAKVTLSNGQIISKKAIKQQ